ncbi:MAG TPA: hypothetical protein VM534_07655, partial [Thermoanaerobaculia bacterium]|nr:hypothetical protein [Thermoanaerobaculia bacterium]
TIRIISPDGMVTTWAGVAGESGAADSTDEDPAGGRLGMPMGLALDRFGNIYVSDARFHTIRRISRERRITTVAGSSGGGGSADGYGNRASFLFPFGLSFDASGNLWIADSDNHTLRRMTPDGHVTTEFGVALERGTRDGNAETARFHRPTGLAFDSRGILFVVDANSHTVRRISPEGEVATVAGRAGERGYQNGTGSVVRFDYPFGIASGANGLLYVADMLNHAIRVGTEEQFGVRGRGARR